MKGFIKVFIVCFFLVSLGCSKIDDADNNVVEYPISDMGYVEIVYENKKIVLQNSIYIFVFNNRLQFNAKNCYEKIQVGLSVPLTIGTHAFDPDSVYGNFYIGENWKCTEEYIKDLFSDTYKDRFIASSGFIKIEEITSEKVKGTFSFSGYTLENVHRTVSITDGRFDLKI
ncbi:hypothetical protein [Hyunsoonleella rubra]|uniref:Lipoprotein n=1 Tax=Hyunsoonleella rubra TaxID=1737062 RepID=A0ABW5TCS7_9FLAO